jgi:DNA anti-recombination protein RmuC
MVNKAVLIDLNERILGLEQFIKGIVNLYSEDLGKNRAQILLEYAQELENLRNDLDEAIQHSDLERIERDIQFIEEVDHHVEEAVETIEHNEAEQIHEELEELHREIEAEHED